MLDGLDVLGGQITRHLTALAFGRAWGERLTGEEVHEELKGMVPHTVHNMLPSTDELIATSDKLHAIGAVAKEGARRRKTPPTYTLTEHGREYVLPLSGALLSWQTENRHRHLQRLWGPEEDRPNREYLALPRIIDAHVRGVTVYGIQRALRNSAPLAPELRRQEALGILDITESFAEEKYLLFKPPAQSARFDFGDDKASWFFTEAADLLHEHNDGQHRTRMSEELFVAEIVYFNPGLDSKEVRGYLRASMRNGSVPFIEHAEPKMRVRISEAWQEPIQKLINRVVNLSHPEQRAAARRRACIISKSPKETYMLMRRSQVIAHL